MCKAVGTQFRAAACRYQSFCSQESCGLVEIVRYIKHRALSHISSQPCECEVAGGTPDFPGSSVQDLPEDRFTTVLLDTGAGLSVCSHPAPVGGAAKVVRLPD